MQIPTLQKTLEAFIITPNTSWGEPTADNTRRTRVPIEQADINTARLNSGTYTQAQYDDFWRQCGDVENGRVSTAYFDHQMPEAYELQYTVHCDTCNKSFQSNLRDAKECFACAIDRMCPWLPGEWIDIHWRREDWWLQCHGDTKKLTYWWHNSNSGGNACHQGLDVFKDTTGKVTRLVLVTFGMHARRTYEITFDLLERTTTYRSGTGTQYWSEFFSPKMVACDEFNGLRLDFVLSMFPSWMLLAHRPRTAGGFFAG